MMELKISKRERAVNEIYAEPIYALGPYLAQGKSLQLNCHTTGMERLSNVAVVC